MHVAFVLAALAASADALPQASTTTASGFNNTHSFVPSETLVSTTTPALSASSQETSTKEEHTATPRFQAYPENVFGDLSQITKTGARVYIKPFIETLTRHYRSETYANVERNAKLILNAWIKPLSPEFSMLCPVIPGNKRKPCRKFCKNDCKALCTNGFKRGCSKDCRPQCIDGCKKYHAMDSGPMVWAGSGSLVYFGNSSIGQFVKDDSLVSGPHDNKTHVANERSFDEEISYARWTASLWAYLEPAFDHKRVGRYMSNLNISRVCVKRLAREVILNELQGTIGEKTKTALQEAEVDSRYDDPDNLPW